MRWGIRRMENERWKVRLLPRDARFWKHQGTISYIAIEDCSSLTTAL